MASRTSDRGGARPAEPGGDAPRRLLLDASSLLYRAFFSVPRSVTDRRGRPVNAVHGYLDMTSRLIRSRRPTGLVHVHDHDWRPAPRVKAYAGYKADRPEEPEELARQFDLLAEVLEAAGAAQAEAPGWEAEDAIATLCARDPDLPTDVVTGDRDLLQIVRDPTVRVLFTVKGVSELRVMDERAVQERYGVPPSRYADFAILRGDPSDGLPGVRGVGEKTAALLVRAYPDLAALAAEAALPRRPSPLLGSAALRGAILDAAPYLRAMREVVPVRTDVAVRTRKGRRSEARLEALAKRHELGGPIGRLRAALDRGSQAGGRP